jgi:hypothetical protein
MTIFPTRSQWIPCQGIEGANCHSITQQDSFLFIDGPGGIYRRQIDDPTWDSACLIGGFIKIRSTGNALFCFGGDMMSSLYRSLDNGFTWEYMDLNYEYRNIENVDSIIFLDTYNDGLLRSFDNGESWTEVDPSPDLAEISWIYSQKGIIYCFLEDVDSLYKSIDYAISWTTYPLTGVIEGGGHPYLYNENLWLASENQFYVFNDLINEWIIQKDSLPVEVYTADFIEDSETLCCYTNHGYFRYDALDSVWIDCSQGLENLWCGDACKVGNTIYLATASGPFSKTGEEQWIPQYEDLFGFTVSQVFVVASRTYALANGKIYYSDEISEGFEILETQGYCPPRQMIVTDTAWYLGSDCGFSISLDSGQTWPEHNAGIEGRRIFQFALADYYYFAEISQPSGHGLFRSRTDSINWEIVPNEFGNAYFHDIDVINNVLFVILGSSSGLYKSTDNGTTFEAVPEAGYNNSHLFVKNNKIFLLRDYDDVLYSKDLGVSWHTWISGVDDYSISCMDITDNDETTVLGGYIAAPWYPVNYLALFTPQYPSGMDIIDNLPAYNWSSVSDVLLFDGSIYACPSSGGLWYRDDLMVGIKEDNLSKKELSDPMQLFPNPLSHFLTIDLQENAAQSEYLIFDQLGRVMKRSLFEKNNSQMTIDVSGLQQGVYFVVIRDSQGGYLTGKFMKID